MGGIGDYKLVDTSKYILNTREDQGCYNVDVEPSLIHKENAEQQS